MIVNAIKSIFDVGGILFDDSKENIDKVLNKDSNIIYKKAYGENFKKCLLGEIKVSEHIESFKNDVDYNDIAYILKKENLNISYPLIETNFEYISKLKNKGYNIYLLTNIPEDSYLYIKNKIDIDKLFNGGIYSYQEYLVKPDVKIYELILKKYYNAKYIHIATNFPKVQEQFIDEIRKHSNAIISIDTHEAYMEKEADYIKKIFDKVDIAFIDKEYTELLNCKAPIKIIKNGKNGCMYNSKNLNFESKTNESKVIDKTGAGDVVTGVFLAMMSITNNPKKSLDKAVEVATISIKDYGVDFLRQSLDIKNKFMTKNKKY